MQAQLVSEILENAKLITASLDEMRELLEKDASDSPLVVKMHEYIPEFRGYLASGKIKATYVCRDVRDVVVSLMNKNNEKFSYKYVEFVRQVLQEWCEWTSCADVYSARYEDMVKDIGGEVVRLSKYLGVEISDSRISMVANKYTLEKNMDRIEGFDYERYGVGSKGNRYDPETLLHHNHIFSGREGQWRSRLKFMEVAVIEHYASGYLEDGGYTVVSGKLSQEASGYLVRLKQRFSLGKR